METEPTIKDAIAAVNDLAEAVNTGFTSVHQDLADIRHNLTETQRQLARTDGKMNALVNVMERKTVITLEEKRSILV